MKHSTNAAKAHANLKQALEHMLKVLKNLKDSLHVVGLEGFPVSTNADIHDHYTYCMCKPTKMYCFTGNFFEILRILSQVLFLPLKISNKYTPMKF